MCKCKGIITPNFIHFPSTDINTLVKLNGSLLTYGMYMLDCLLQLLFHRRGVLFACFTIEYPATAPCVIAIFPLSMPVILPATNKPGRGFPSLRNGEERARLIPECNGMDSQLQQLAQQEDISHLQYKRNLPHIFVPIQ